MEKQGVISSVTEPTSWCSGIVVVPKPNGSVHICVDLTHLNKAVQREVHPMFSVDESLAKLGQSKIFSKLDAKSGFWQIPLCPETGRVQTPHHLHHALWLLLLQSALAPPVKSSSGQCHRS